MRWLLPLSLCLFSCSEYGFASHNNNTDVPYVSPEIKVDPMLVDLGIGDGTSNELLQSIVNISNVGNADLVIERIEIDGPFSGIKWKNAIIEPHQTKEFSISYTSVGDVTSVGGLRIYSNDDDEGVVDVTLAANAIAPILYLEPADIDFAEVGITCIAEDFFSIGNIGRAPLEIEEISSNLADDFYFEFLETPTAVGANKVFENVIGFTPTEPMSRLGDITITSNAWNSSNENVEVTATGMWGPRVEDTFQQIEVISADILFTIDNSCSMGDEQSEISTNATLFMTALEATGIDYQVGVITTDSPVLFAPIITNASADPVGDFEAAVMVGVGGDADEQGLQMTRDATGTRAIPGFIRESSILAMVVVSDEEDASSSSTAEYANHFESLKPNPDHVSFHSVVPLTDPTAFGGCGTSAGLRYTDVSLLTDGLAFDICIGAWGSFLETIVIDATAPVNRFDLTDEPVEETIEVMVDGMWDMRWDYYSGPPRIVFWPDAIPSSLAMVNISYNIWPDCDQ